MELRLTASVGSGRALMRRKWAETLAPSGPVPTPRFYSAELSAR